MLFKNDESKINKTIGIKPEIWEAVVKNEIPNFSKFVNELLEDALMDRDLQRAYLVKRVTELQKEFKKIDYVLEIDEIKDDRQ